MATRVHESGAVDASIDKVWDILRPLDFSFLPAVATSVVEGRQNPARVGGVRRVIYKDGTLQRIKLMELNDATHTLTYDVITSEPPVPYSSAIHTIRLRRVTFGGKTLVEFTSDFSNDASLSVIADAKWKRLEILSGLREKVASQKQAPVNVEDFRKRAALADQLIAGLTERLGALERSRRTQQESKGGQIFLEARGESKDGERFVSFQKEWAQKARKNVSGLILHSGATFADETHYVIFIAWESNAALIEYLTYKQKEWKDKNVTDSAFNTHFTFFGPVSKAAKEVISTARNFQQSPPTYLEFNGFIR